MEIGIIACSILSNIHSEYYLQILSSDRKSIGIHQLDVVREDFQEERLMVKSTGSKVS